jgi:hypothetical protein
MGGEEKTISTAGGMWPWWNPNGKEIVYVAPDNTLTAVSVSGDASSLTVGAARRLFQIRPRPQVRLDAYPYGVSPDGQRVIVNTFVEETASNPITLAINWNAELKK